MTPDLQNLQSFLTNLQNKTISEISQACAKKIREMQVLEKPDAALIENLKSIILLIGHLRKPPIARDEEARQLLINFFTHVLQHDRRARHPLEVLEKSP